MRKISIILFGALIVAGCATQQETQGQPNDTPENQQMAGDQVAAAPVMAPGARLVPVGGTGWARSSINAAIFRTSSLASHGDTQYIAYYDGDGNLMLGKRKLGTMVWEVRKTQYTGQVRDAHNAISMGVDGKGVLHLSWDMHNQALRYVRSTAPGSLELTAPMQMTGDKENQVTYPQFYTMPSGDMLFAYRDGASGDGDLMLNHYDVQADKWEVVQHPLIDGQGQRNPYVNTIAVDSKGGLHVSWCWRESPDAASNHDICYAFSPDNGKTWRKTNGQAYTLPITMQTAEVAWPVPQRSDLINQTSMTVDSNDHPVIATYWRDQDSQVPQYRVVWYDGHEWKSHEAGERTQEFHIGGGGTLRIPISRPQVVAGANNTIYLIFRDEERGNGVSVAMSQDAEHEQWRVIDLLKDRAGAWEPSFDVDAWKRSQELHIFFQRVGQGNAETLESVPPQPVSVIEWKP